MIAQEGFLAGFMKMAGKIQRVAGCGLRIKTQIVVGHARVVQLLQLKAA